MKKNIIVCIVLVICAFEVLFGIGAYLKHKEKRTRLIACRDFNDSHKYKDVLPNATIAIVDIKETPYKEEDVQNGFKSLVIDTEIFNSSYKNLNGVILSWNVRCSDGKRYLAHQCDEKTLKDFMIKPSQTTRKELHFEIPKDSKIVAFEGHIHVEEENAEKFSIALDK